MPIKVTHETIKNYRHTQDLARYTMHYAQEVIKPGMSIKMIVEILENHMNSLGSEYFWYYKVGALVFHGKDTTISVSGKDYVPSKSLIKPVDLNYN